MTLQTSFTSNPEATGGAAASASTPMVDRMARNAHSAVDRVAETASSAVGRVRSGVTGTLSTLNDQVHGLSSSREQWVDTCRQSVRDHPLAAVGAGLAAGYLIARWLRS